MAPVLPAQQMAREFATQGHISQQLQQLQRQYREFEKQRQHQVQIDKESLQNNNIVLKEEDEEQPEPAQQVIQKVPDVVQKHEAAETPTYTTMQAPEVFLSLGFKDARGDEVKHSDGRTSLGPIAEFLKIRPVAEPLITVNPQIISQTMKQQNATCRECGKTFGSINLLNNHTSGAVNILNDQTVDIVLKEEHPQVANLTQQTSRQLFCKLFL